MKRVIYVIGGLLLMVSCTSRKNSNDVYVSDMDSVAVMDSMRPDMPPPPPDSGSFDGHRPPPPPPPHGKGRPPHKPDNMRGFDPASEDDMEDNGMSRYMENNDEEGWD
jgi:hypothetical protein